jgi:uncharacterized protein YaiE (UPF0345 family)
MSWDLTGNTNTDENVDFVGTTDSHALVIRTNNKEALRVNAAGNVGLGTATPGEHLTVGGGTLADTKIEINAGGNQYAGLRIKNSQVSWNWQVVPSTDSPGGRLRLADETAGREWLSITHNGNVGIGSTNPAQLLDVAGSANASNWYLVGQTATNAGTVGFGNTNGPGIQFWGIGTGNSGAMIFLTAGAERMRIDANGDTTLNGALTMGSGKDIILSDVAEDFDIADVQAEPGTVMAIDHDGNLRPCSSPYDQKVAGIVSGAGDYRPAVVLGKTAQTCNRRSVALVGKAYCKVEGDSSPIEVGDLLTTSSVPGHAMKAADQFKAFGAVIGKALRPWRGGRGLIPILIALQ